MNVGQFNLGTYPCHQAHPYIPTGWCVGMMLRNKHTGDEQMIVDMYEQVVEFQGWKLKPNQVNLAHSNLTPIVYVLEDKEGERHNWNALYMKHWEIVKQKNEGEEE